MGSLATFLSRLDGADEDAVSHALAAAPHRGSNARAITLGRCVIGVTNGEGRPDASLALSGDLAAGFVGELDNRAELVEQLRAGGTEVAEPTPAAVLLAGFREFGEGLANRMRGAFGAVVTDGARVWCWRDHVGFGTLFYRADGRGLCAASEAKQVVAGAGVRREPDPDVVERIFYGDLDDETPAALKGVRRLPKATVLTADGAFARLRAYWHPEELLETARYSPDELQERFDELFTQAVGRTVTGNDVVSLSGGIDSPPVAAFAAPLHLDVADRPISALSAVYPDQPSVDEREWIEMVTDFLGIPLHTYERKARTLDHLQHWVRLLDGPVPSILHSDVEEHYRHAQRLGFRTMLTGEVAEFVFAMRGYTPAHLLFNRRFSALGRYVGAQVSSGTPKAKVAWHLASAVAPRWLAARYERVNGSVGARAPSWVDVSRVRDVRARYQVPARERWATQQLLGLTGPGISMEADDVIQAMYGVRTRRPWADVDLWEFFLSLPAEVKYPDGIRKGLVRKLLDGKVPDPILKRRGKTGFEASFMARIDYDALRHWLLDPPVRMPGVDHDLLAQRLEREDFTVYDHHWASDLAGAYAFLAS